MAKPKKKRLPTFSSLEAKLDKVFSQWIRNRFIRPDGMVECVTCGKVDFPSNMNAGHFWKRQHRATRWVPENVHVQCVRCNKFRGGAEAEHAAYILNAYGQAAFMNLEELHSKPMKFSRAELQELIQRYSQPVGETKMERAA